MLYLTQHKTLLCAYTQASQHISMIINAFMNAPLHIGHCQCECKLWCARYLPRLAQKCTDTYFANHEFVSAFPIFGYHTVMTDKSYLGAFCRCDCARCKLYSRGRIFFVLLSKSRSSLSEQYPNVSRLDFFFVVLRSLGLSSRFSQSLKSSS